MPKYIKSHSNYRLSTKHQSVRNGTVLERDISTVGGVNSFATGQSTIYSSGNFIMTVNNTASASRHIVKKGWLPNSENGKFLRDIAFICKQLTIQTFSQHIEYRWIFVANVCTSENKSNYLTSIITSARCSLNP